jgi:Bacterial archaeo-eukaryotic release factor family 7
MINLPTSDELMDLKSFDRPFCLTIYAPFIDPNAPTNPNRIELKNLLREAEKALLSSGVTPAVVKKTLKPAQQLDKHEFWPIHHESLVLFIHPEFFRYYRIPNATIPYMLTIETGFNLDPLLKVMENNQQYYILTLGHKNVRLYEGDHYSLKPVQLKNFPSDMKNTLGIDEYPKSSETHTIGPTRGRKGSKAYHGQYNVSQTDKTMLLEFFRQVDQRLHNFLHYHKKPLILAGVKYLQPIYHKVNSYPGLLNKSIAGNQDNPNLFALREQALQLLKEHKL